MYWKDIGGKPPTFCFNFKKILWKKNLYIDKWFLYINFSILNIILFISFYLSPIERKVNMNSFFNKIYSCCIGCSNQLVLNFICNNIMPSIVFFNHKTILNTIGQIHDLRTEIVKGNGLHKSRWCQTYYALGRHRRNIALLS